MLTGKSHAEMAKLNECPLDPGDCWLFELVVSGLIVLYHVY